MAASGTNSLTYKLLTKNMTRIFEAFKAFQQWILHLSIIINESGQKY
jgi:hypothetical protein